MQLCPNRKTLPQFFSAFPESTLNFEFFEKKRASEVICFRNYRMQKSGLLKILKSLVLEHWWTVNILKCPKHHLHLHGSIFVMFLGLSEKKSALKFLFQ